MRTLNADLTTAQKSAAPTPYMEITFRSRDGATVRTYKTTDSPNRIVTVQQAEGTTNGHISSPGDRPYSMIVRLRDQDKTIMDLDFDGYRCDIGWGFNTTSGNRFSVGPMGFVINTKVISTHGHIYTELSCISAWDKLALSWPNDLTASVLSFSKDRTIRHILQEILGGAVCAAAQLDDGGVFTVFTSESADTTADNVNLLPSTPAVNDAFYFGFGSRFDRISIDLTTVGVGTWTITWEYWNGSVWTTLQDITDAGVSGNLIETTGIDAFKTGQLQIVDFLLPSDAAANTVNSLGPFFYIRARVSSFSSITTQPKATRIFLGNDFGLALDTSDAAQGDDFSPEYESDYRVSVRQMVEHMLEMTEMGIFVQRDGFHLRFIDNAESGNNYAYDSNHNSFSSIRSSSVIIPNKVIYTDRDPAAGGTAVTGNDEDTNSSGAIGVIPVVIVDDSITAGSIGTTLAQRHIRRLNRDTQQGSLIAPMNVGQEIWDLVSITDARTSKTFKGRVSQILRTIIPGQYDIQLVLGGVVSFIRTDFDEFEYTSARERAANAARRDDSRAEARTIAVQDITNDLVAAMIESGRISSAGEQVIETARLIQDLARTPINARTILEALDPFGSEESEGIFGSDLLPKSRGAPSMLDILFRLIGSVNNTGRVVDIPDFSAEGADFSPTTKTVTRVPRAFGSTSSPRDE